MRINNKKSNSKKWCLIIALFVLLIIGLLIVYFVWYVPSQNSDNTNDTTNYLDTNSMIDSEYIDQSVMDREAEKNPIQSDSSEVDQNSLTGYITAKNVLDGKLQIRIQIEQYLTSGTCKITVGDYSEQVNVISNPSSSTCEGWDILTSKLQKGVQPITIDIKSGENSLIITDEVTI